MPKKDAFTDLGQALQSSEPAEAPQGGDGMNITDNAGRVVELGLSGAENKSSEE